MLFYSLVLEFEALVSIHSLPPFHGARWSALFRFACQKAQIDIEKCILGIYPFRKDEKPILKGEKISIRLLFCHGAEKEWEKLFIALCSRSEVRGEFSLGNTLELSKVFDELTGKILYKKNSILPISLSQIKVFSENNVFEKALLLYRANTWTICFDSPLRLTFSGNPKKEKGHFVSAEYFNAPNSMFALFGKIRYLQKKDYSIQQGNVQTKTIENSLSWVDIRYNKNRKIALGGLVGSLRVEAQLSFEMALSLSMGEFSGIGKNARFGLGFYRVFL